MNTIGIGIIFLINRYLAFPINRIIHNMKHMFLSFRPIAILDK